MSLTALLTELSYDLRRYGRRLRRPAIAIALLFPGFQALAAYRVCRWLNLRGRRGWWVGPFQLAEAIALRLVQIGTGIEIHPQARIGRGLFLAHPGAVVIGEGVVIGDNCAIFQGVTLGYSGRREPGYPCLGDRVFVAAGAKVIGPVQVGSDVAIGANAVVARSVPDYAVVAGIPAQIISWAGSFDYVDYPGREHDPDWLGSQERHRQLFGPRLSAAVSFVGEASEVFKASEVRGEEHRRIL